MTTESYLDAMPMEVNPGYDTDSTAAVTGGLGGVTDGVMGIPEECLHVPARLEDIDNLAEKLASRPRTST